jgi:hypothetical protein
MKKSFLDSIMFQSFGSIEFLIIDRLSDLTEITKI